MSKLIFHPFLIFLAQIVNSHLVEEIQYLKTENRIMRSKLGYRVVTTQEEKAQLLRFGIPLGDRLKDLISIVTYETFRNWARGKFYKGSGKVGRPATPEEIRNLIISMAQCNRDWGYKKIRDELNKLHISVARSTIQNILRSVGLEPIPDRKIKKWTRFVRAHIDTLIACDFFTKEIWTLKGKVTMYVLVFIELRNRRVHLAGITRYPNQRWCEIRAEKVLRDIEKSGFHPTHLIRDRDCKYSEKFDELFTDKGIKILKTPVKMPTCNVYCERAIQTLKHEGLNHFTVFGKRHLEYLVKEFLTYYNNFRPHQGIGGVTINELPPCPKTGTIEKMSFLGGLHHHYYRKAA